MTDRDLIAEGRALDTAATPPPWFNVGNDLVGGRCIRTELAVPSADYGRTLVDLIAGDSDAALIVWMRNNLPALLDALEAAQRPPLGYVVVAHHPGQRPYMPSAVTPAHQAIEDAAAEATGKSSGPDGKWRYTVAEVREVAP